MSNEEVLQLCTEMADGTVLPAGWSKGYDTQRNRLYFVDEVFPIRHYNAYCIAASLEKASRNVLHAHRKLGC